MKRPTRKSHSGQPSKRERRTKRDRRSSRALGIELLEQRSLLDGTPMLLGPEFLVNTETLNSQQNSDVAMDADGNFVVVWEGFDDDQRGIFGQRFDPFGQPLGSEFRVNVSSLDNQVTPAVAMDEDGDFVVVWSTQGSYYYQYGSGSGFFIPFSEIRGRRFDANGVPQDVPGMPGVTEFAVNPIGPINQFPDNLQRNPDVAMDSSGDFVVAWDQNYSYPGNFDVYFRRFNAAGAAQGGRVRVNTDFVFGQDITPAVAMDEDGDFVVAFDRNAGSGYLSGIFARQFNAAGVPQTAMEFQVDNGVTEADVVREPAAGMDATGDFVIAWTERAPPNGPAHFDIRARRFNSAGVPQDVPGMPGVSEFLVNTDAVGDQSEPAVAMNGAGQFLIVWAGQGNGGGDTDIYGQFYAADGSREGDEFEINTTEAGNQRRPSAAINDNCDFIVTWDGEGPGDDQGVFAQRLISCSLIVTPGAADGAMGSLRKAILCANLTPGPDTIFVPDGIYNLTIAGQFEDLGETGDLDITDDLTIVGFSTDGTIIDAGDLDRVFHIIGGITVNLSGMTIRNGLAPSNGNGGGILNFGSLTLTNVTVRESQAGKGGGIYQTGGNTLQLINSTIALNTASGGKGAGGGILNNSGTVLITDSNILGNTATLQGGGLLNTGDLMVIERSTIAHSTAGDGGGAGIFNRAPMTIVNSTISDNDTTGNGGGISNTGGGASLSLSFVTIADNHSNTDAIEDASGGGVYDTTQTGFQAGSTIIATNTDGVNDGPDIFGMLVSQGFNLIGNTAGAMISGDTTGNILNVDPLLGPLANNGGPTPTHALLSGSPALDTGEPDEPPAIDQRGVPRPQGPAPDIGAFEALQVMIDDVTVVEGNSGTVNAVFTVTLSNPPTQPVTVVFATADGTATNANDDYEPTTGTLTFMPGDFSANPGETIKMITVMVNGDLAVEPNESFFVNLFTDGKSTVVDGPGVGTILNDDEDGEAPPPILVTGADAGGGPHVKVFNASTRELLFEFMAYNINFAGGVRVAVGDLNADGTPDIITGAGPGGGPHVRAFDGANGQQLPGLVGSFFAYNANFAGGVYVASGDVNGDGADDIITGADAGGGPHVRVFDGRTGLQLPGLIGSFFAYKSEANAGVRVAAGDVNGDGRADVITGMGPGYAVDAERPGFNLINQPEVRIFSGASGAMLRSFLPFEPGYRGGVHLAVGDFDSGAGSTGQPVPQVQIEIVIAKANGDARTDAAFDFAHIDPFRKPQVSIFRYQDMAPPLLLASFEAYSNFGGSVRVGIVEGVFKEFDPGTDADDYFGLALITGAGPTGGPHVRLRSEDLGTVLDEFFAYDPSFLGGIFVAGSMRPASAPPGGS